MILVWDELYIEDFVTVIVAFLSTSFSPVYYNGIVVSDSVAVSDRLGQRVDLFYFNKLALCVL